MRGCTRPQGLVFDSAESTWREYRCRLWNVQRFQRTTDNEPGSNCLRLAIYSHTAGFDCFISQLLQQLPVLQLRFKKGFAKKDLKMAANNGSGIRVASAPEWAKGLSFTPAVYDNSPLNFDSFHNIIDGKLSGTELTRHTTNPSNLEANPESPVSTEQDVNRAVDAAVAAGKEWAKVPWDERRKAIEAYADAIVVHADAFAAMLVKEMGLPVSKYP